METTARTINVPFASQEFSLNEDILRYRPRFASALGRSSVFLMSDLAALLSSTALACVLWAGMCLQQPLATYVPLLPLVLVFPIAYATVDLYPGSGLGTVETLRRLSYSTSVSFLVLGSATFAFRITPEYSRIAFLIAWALALVNVPLYRSLTELVASRFQWWPEPAVVFGTTADAESTLLALEEAGQAGFRILGVLCSDARSRGQYVRGVAVLGGSELLSELSRRGVSTILSVDRGSEAAMLPQIQHLVPRVVFVRTVNNLPVEQAQLRNFGGILGIELTNELLRPGKRLLKRVLDVTLGVSCLLVATPIIVASALLVKVFSSGPIFFRQQREGLFTRRFSLWKLRTMHPDAEGRLTQLLENSPELKRQWERNVKLAQDPRVIPVVGRFLRRFSIDELPQLWNVVVGDMSLVGPRPLPEYHLARLSDEVRKLRCSIRPGLTGMWQVMVRGNGSLADQERFDAYYVRNWSVWLDLWILARTLTAVFVGRGAY